MKDPTDLLALSLRHLVSASSVIARQEDLIRRLRRTGCDTGQADKLLQLFLDIQAVMLSHHRSIERDMAAWSAAHPS